MRSLKDFESSLPLREKRSNNERVSTRKLTLFYFIVITWSVPLHDTLTPVGREENVALFPEYLIVTVVVNVAFSTKSSGPDSRKSFLETRVLLM